MQKTRSLLQDWVTSMSPTEGSRTLNVSTEPRSKSCDRRSVLKDAICLLFIVRLPSSQAVKINT
eukprot:scaffold517563_cov24-Prasinocladus_malaysianus.AAC.1